MNYQDIHYDASEGIATITIDRPDVMNAVSHHTLDELTDALSRADEDDAVRVVIITGAGERAFCAGTDLSRSNWTGRPGDPATGEGVPPDAAAKVPLRIYDMRKPVIGAINGAAVGFGASVLCSMDIRLISDHARIGFIYAKRGICNESCSSFFLPRVVGISRAMEWVFSGRMINAAELLAANFVHEAVPKADLLPRAQALAREIATQTSPAAIAVSRHLMWRNLAADHPQQASDMECRGLTGLMRLPDASEGGRAFMEKRPPRFTTRPSTDVDFMAHWWPRASSNDAA